MADEKFNPSDFMDDGGDSSSLIGGDSETNDILGISIPDNSQDSNESYFDLGDDDDDPSTELKPKPLRTPVPEDPEPPRFKTQNVPSYHDRTRQAPAAMRPAHVDIQNEDIYSTLDDLTDDDSDENAGDDYDLQNETDSDQDDEIETVIPVQDEPRRAPEPRPTPERTARIERQEPQEPEVVTIPVIPSASGSASAVPDDHASSPSMIDTGMISKIITIIDHYRRLDKPSQRTVNQFIVAIAALKRRTITNPDEATIVREVIYVDPDARAGVHNLLEARSRTGADRAFFLMGLDSKSLMNVDIFLRMLRITKESISIKEETLASIKQAAQEINSLIDKLKDEQIPYIKKLDGMLQSAMKVMQS
jgi:hypothetical protein